ncbi:hypothetical protein B0T21DRAFT_357554 [Apiosordaria backusii]|uniref:Uncharacterized protein n=1 Tax=Apiosordaria backusii TaxID=314023 RepID=A0AA40K3H1_9PEZI|nr:hypothetical protein B0T21DRAFT_357554 [Apiosordaria backusii]
MAISASNYRDHIAKTLLGKSGDFQAYFKVYNDLLDRGPRNVITQAPHQPRNSISHETILAATDIIKKDSRVTLESTRRMIGQRFPNTYSTDELDFILEVAVQAMFMIDPNVNGSHGLGYMVGTYRPASWSANESFIDFVNKSFPQVSTEKRAQVETVLENKRSLKAWKLQDRVGIEFRGTNNLTDHLLLDRDNRILYLFHHTAYLKAHLNLWYRLCGDGAKEVGIGSALERGMLSPRLLAETLHSLQTILFSYDDYRSMHLLNNTLIKKKKFDSSCAILEGYLPFADGPGDFVYTYWGDRLMILHDLVRDRPPRTKFEKWIKWQTTERNFFLVAGLALIISAVVGILSLVLAIFQSIVAWQAWKHPATSG